jgi:hypothetical protein
VGKLFLIVDEKATDNNKQMLQSLANQFRGLKGSEKFLDIPRYSGKLTITDNIHSPIITKANYEKNFMRPDFVARFRAFDQKVGPLAIVFNPNLVDSKPRINSLVHEIGHMR